MSMRNAELQKLLASLNGSNIEQITATANAQQQGPLQNQNSSQLQQNFANNSNGVQSNSTHHALKPPSHEADRSRSTTPLKVPDASNITTWPAALKHVSKHIATNEASAARIKHLINEQHKHEFQWWKQRQEIVTRHANRSGNSAKVADILKELGGLAVPVVQTDAAADKGELDAFDKKVYKSTVQMAADFDSQLRKLGVPFFVVKHELILAEGTKGSEGVSSLGKLDKGELRELQKRMLQHLEDLLGDE